jgi:hypothetical protein
MASVDAAALPLAQMECAIRSQTVERPREPLVATGFPNRRFDRSSSLAPRHPRAAQAVTGCGQSPHHASAWPKPVLPAGLSGWSITAETPWRFDCPKLREIEFDNRL